MRKDNEVYITDGEFSSVWDDGDTTVTSDAKIDLDNMEVISMSNERTYVGDFLPWAGDGYDDGMVDHLEEEYMDVNGERHSAYPKDEYDPEYDEDKYGNGVILY